MSVIVKSGLIAAVALAVIGCNQVADADPRHSVTVKLSPALAYRPEPGFSLATDLPVRSDKPVNPGTNPGS
jgi:hypothetical protein